MELGERIAVLREERALTQAELAERAKISASTLSQIESGRVPRPHVGTVRKIARALGVEPMTLRRTEEPATAGKAEPRPTAGPDYLRMEHAIFAEAVKEADPEELVRIADHIRKERDRYLAEEDSDPVRPLARLGYVVAYIQTRGTEEHKERALQIKRELSGAA